MSGAIDEVCVGEEEKRSYKTRFEYHMVPPCSFHLRPGQYFWTYFSNVFFVVSTIRWPAWSNLASFTGSTHGWIESSMFLMALISKPPCAPGRTVRERYARVELRHGDGLISALVTLLPLHARAHLEMSRSWRRLATILLYQSTYCNHLSAAVRLCFHGSTPERLRMLVTMRIDNVVQNPPTGT